ncbi:MULTISPECIES: DUF4365 domain-containing protein [unclassified Rhizobium]|uniref:DUF4365 domain-containing protein n=1 Tax=unclassified Rhizobium TaxID=2613769 RepID=UPI00177C8C14|nr:DUF4365 domain-containing protein [Rhizobium sp. CFBP 13644]MBD8693111.1 DUF4365 domain-containing protein [Rhizobium sp. CFBP 13717]
MPNYTKAQISGDAGQYLVAYTVTRILGWPCRLLGIDIGLDAEIEIIDDEGRSDGDIIKLQIKSKDFLKHGDNHIYIEEEHLKYWKNFSAPIIVCCVDHSTRKIYWQPIVQSEPYLCDGASRRLTFNTVTSREIDFGSKKTLKGMVTPPHLKDFSLHLQFLKAFCIKWEVYNGVSTDTFDEINTDISAAEKHRTFLEGAMKVFPFRFSSADEDTIRKSFEMRNRLEVMMRLERNGNL